jgi:hypothetical protein
MEKKMKKMYSVIALFALLLIPLLLTAQEIDISGDWELSAEMRGREITQNVQFEQDGEKLTVTMEGRMGESTGEGIIKGNKVEWSITRSTQRGEFKISYAGTVEGDTMSGEAQMGDFGSMEWTAKKK